MHAYWSTVSNEFYPSLLYKTALASDLCAGYQRSSRSPWEARAKRGNVDRWSQCQSWWEWIYPKHVCMYLIEWELFTHVYSIQCVGLDNWSKFFSQVSATWMVSLTCMYYKKGVSNDYNTWKVQICSTFGLISFSLCTNDVDQGDAVSFPTIPTTQQVVTAGLYSAETRVNECAVIVRCNFLTCYLHNSVVSLSIHCSVHVRLTNMIWRNWSL